MTVSRPIVTCRSYIRQKYTSFQFIMLLPLALAYYCHVLLHVLQTAHDVHMHPAF